MFGIGILLKKLIFKEKNSSTDTISITIKESTVITNKEIAVMELNNHISEYLRYYVAMPLPPNYAVMIRGSWGSGKSFFIKNFIKNDLDHKYLYVSLYGISSYEDIETAFFKQLNPRFASEGMQFAGAVLKGLLKSTLKIDLNVYGDSKSDASLNTTSLPDMKIFESFRKASDHVLVFDDLERCSLPLADMMGYINQLVENDNLKAIILANEDELLKQSSSPIKGNETKINSDNNVTKYSLIKEKLIGKSFSIEADIDSSIEHFLNDIRESNIKVLLENNIATIKDLFIKSKYDNLRHLKQAFLDFERFIKYIPSESLVKEDLSKRLIEVFFVITFELKKGEFKEQNILDIYNIVTYIKSAEPSYTQEVAKKYNVFDRLLNPIGPEFWHAYFTTSTLDRDAVKSSIFNSIYYDLENTPNWKKLKNIWTTESGQFDNLYNEVYRDFSTNNIDDKYVLLHIVDMFLFFSEHNIITLSRDDIYELAENNINHLKSIGVLNHQINESLTIDRTLGIEYFDKKNNYFEKIYFLLKESIESTKKDTYEEIANELLSLLENSVDKFEDLLLINSYGTSRFYETPILVYIDKEKFMSIFWKLSPLDQRHLGSVFAKRYSYEDFNAKLINELEWLEVIFTTVEAECNKTNSSLKKYLLKNGFLKYTSQAVQSLSNKK